MRRLYGAEGKQLERGLKWFLSLSQMLLRKPRRGGKSGRGDVARRFNCLARNQDWGALLSLWEKDRRQMREEEGQESRGRKKETEEQVVNRKRRKVVKLLSQGKSGKAEAMIGSHGVASMADPAVREQLAAKYPGRKKQLPTLVTQDSPIENLKGLQDALLGLKKGVAPETGGLRTEFLTALAEVMEPPQMRLLEDFLLCFLQSKLPPWFTQVWQTVQTVPLWKTEEQDAVRPIGIRNPLVKVGDREVIADTKAEFRDVFEPQQLGLSEGAAAKLVHSFRMYLEENEHCCLVKGDMKNGFNEVAQASIVAGLEEEPSLQHLAWYGGTTYAAGHGLESGGKVWGQSEEGETQGAPRAGAFFCVGWQKYLRQLDETVSAAGGMARAGWDDLYVVGPPLVVFPAMEVFWGQLEEHCGLECQGTKTVVYTRSGEVPQGKPADWPMAGMEVEGTWVPGFILYGVPVGEDKFVVASLQDKVREVAKSAAQACKLLSNERQALWTLLRTSMKFKFEYWLSLVYPTLVMEAARGVDQILWGVLEAAAGQHIPKTEEGLGWEEVLEVPVSDLGGRSFQSWLVGLPVRLGGLGLTSQEELAPIAFLASLLQALPFFGGDKGVCPTLASMSGKPGDQQWAPLLASGCRTGRELLAAWQSLQREATEAAEFLGKEVEGPVAEMVEKMGGGLSSKELRRQLCRAREHTRLQVFQKAVRCHRNQKAISISSVKEMDKLSTAWLLSRPGPRFGLSSPIFAEGMATLLSLPSRVCADRIGEKVGGSRADQHGVKVINANLPGGHWTARHNTRRARSV